MKTKFFIAAAIALSASPMMADNYNSVGISYNNTSYTYNNDFDDDHKDNNFSTNGFGLTYIRGWQISSFPLYLETGLNCNMNFYSEKSPYGYWRPWKVNFKNMNIILPVNIGYRFMVANELISIQPFAGINFKLNLFTKSKESIDYKDLEIAYDGKWIDHYNSSNENMGSSDYTWNRLQMGWQIGVTFSYRHLFFTVQYGTDFISAYSHKFEYIDDSITVKSTPKINNGNFRFTLGYTF